ncbi:MAG: glycosyltransferase family 9 protein [Vicingaceae bacterium]
MLKDCIKTLFIIWRRKNVEIIDLERTSNLSGIFRLMCTIGNSCSSFTFKSENLDYKNQRFITLQNKTAFNAISEIFQLENKPISTSKNINKTNNIVININAGDYLPQRKYPINYFVKLIKNLHQHNPSFQFIFTGSKTEINYTNTLTKQLDALSIAYKNTAGKLSLNELAALLKNAQIFITNDSGPLHLAYYYKTPTVAIWGPTSAQLVGYPTSDNMKNVSLNKSCSPCFIHPKSNVAKACNNKIDCFKELDADKILDAVLELHQSLNKKTNVK